ncbi:hypothetical protein JOF56_008869 [Kibdelosporangium banguiense]|uniref:DUF1772 domain-containing protein n=1 Tax=Kibdelosporangium banguiense TaxID=1365924 RepID=A0ABS4TVP7_9PSEU|nr:hypothetical protein [Kibdelosporangium banguiense]MBP2328484.1 hypothetical protein [Kibdelosporangium banguiense]
MIDTGSTYRTRVVVTAILAWGAGLALQAMVFRYVLAHWDEVLVSVRAKHISGQEIGEALTRDLYTALLYVFLLTGVLLLVLLPVVVRRSKAAAIGIVALAAPYAAVGVFMQVRSLVTDWATSRDTAPALSHVGPEWMRWSNTVGGLLITVGAIATIAVLCSRRRS